MGEDGVQAKTKGGGKKRFKESIRKVVSGSGGGCVRKHMG